LIGVLALLAAELAVLVEAGRLIGVVPAVLLLIATGVFGPPLVRRAGFGVWRRARSRLDQGEVPGRELLDGLVLLIAGVLICVPGFITDIVGGLLLLPPVRAVARGVVLRRFARRTRLVMATSAMVRDRAGVRGTVTGAAQAGGWSGGAIEAVAHERQGGAIEAVPPNPPPAAPPAPPRGIPLAPPVGAPPPSVPDEGR